MSILSLTLSSPSRWPWKRFIATQPPSILWNPAASPCMPNKEVRRNLPSFLPFFLAKTCKLEEKTCSLSQDTCSIIPGILSYGFCNYYSQSFHKVYNVRPKLGLHMLKSSYLLDQTLIKL